MKMTSLLAVCFRVYMTDEERCQVDKNGAGNIWPYGKNNKFDERRWCDASFLHWLDGTSISLNVYTGAPNDDVCRATSFFFILYFIDWPCVYHRQESVVRLTCIDIEIMEEHLKKKMLVSACQSWQHLNYLGWVNILTTARRRWILRLNLWVGHNCNACQATPRVRHGHPWKDVSLLL